MPAAALLTPPFLPGIEARLQLSTSQLAWFRLEVSADAPAWDRVNSSGPCAAIAIARRGYRLRFRGRHQVVVPGHAVVAGAAREFGRELIDPQGERSDLLYLAPDLVEQLNFDRPQADDGFTPVRVDPRDLLLSELLTHCNVSTSAESLAREELLLGIVERAWSAAAGAKSLPASKPRRASTLAAHARSVARAQEFILTNVDQILSLESIARAAAVAPLHLCRIFRASVGSTVHDFVQHVRCAVALELIRSTSRTTQEIALAVGLRSRPHFSVMLRERFGWTPSRIARAMREASVGSVLRLMGSNAQDSEHTPTASS